MLKKTLLLLPVMVLVLAALLCCQGCTIKFKSTDMEFDAHVTKAFVFDGVEFTNGKVSKY